MARCGGLLIRGTECFREKRIRILRILSRRAGLVFDGELCSNMFMKMFYALCLALFTVAATAAEQPYNESADAKLDIKQALAQATAAHTPVIVVFGANWCGDCRMLNKAMKTGTSAPLLAHDFQIVKVNIGHFDKNVDIAESYGVPLKKGIPAVVILSNQNQVLYATRDGEVADARRMGEDGVYKFFKRVTADALAKK